MNEKSPNDDSPSLNRTLAYVLDSFALLAFLGDEEGADKVADLIRRAPEGTRLFLSIINWGEVAYETERERGEEALQKTLGRISRLPIAFMGVDERIVLSAAKIKARHRVSYADAFAVALAQELGATIVTGDPEFQSVAKVVDILWLREPTPKKRTPGGKESREHRAAYNIRPKRKRRQPALR